jgi:hypothetical protein
MNRNTNFLKKKEYSNNEIELQKINQLAKKLREIENTPIVLNKKSLKNISIINRVKNEQITRNTSKRNMDNNNNNNNRSTKKNSGIMDKWMNKIDKIMKRGIKRIFVKKENKKYQENLNGRLDRLYKSLIKMKKERDEKKRNRIEREKKDKKIKNMETQEKKLKDNLKKCKIEKEKLELKIDTMIKRFNKILLSSK